MKLIFGLGNPGLEYSKTRHNVGFSYLDYIAGKKGLKFKESKFKADETSFFINNEKILLIKPLSFMNLSGGIVKKYVDYYDVSLKDILVIHDDLDMMFGKVKIMFAHNSGGHNGIKNINDCLKSNQYARLKIGISRDSSIEVKNYVLGKFNKEELNKIQNTFVNISDLVDDFCIISISELMNKYNKK